MLVMLVACGTSFKVTSCSSETSPLNGRNSELLSWVHFSTSPCASLSIFPSSSSLLLLVHLLNQSVDSCEFSFLTHTKWLNRVSSPLLNFGPGRLPGPWKEKQEEKEREVTFQLCNWARATTGKVFSLSSIHSERDASKWLNGTGWVTLDVLLVVSLDVT